MHGLTPGEGTKQLAGPIDDQRAAQAPWEFLDEVVSNAANPTTPGPDRPLHREMTAQYLGLGIFLAFAFVVLCIGISQIAAIVIMAEPPPTTLNPEQVEAWFRWREQLAGSVTNFTQTMGALLAGPLGVVLGFYFRDRAT
jgi:hypothetical protein